MDNPKDAVREELELIRTLNLRPIQVLLHGTQPPLGGVLPETLRWMEDRKAVWLRQNTWRTDVAALIDRLDKKKPGNRFAGWGELGRLTRTPDRRTHRFRLAISAIAKPCALALGTIIAIIGLLASEPVLVPLGAASYLLLTLVAFFTLFEAETVGARERQRTAEREPAGLDPGIK